MQNDYAENLEFFKWLFDKDELDLESTVDLTLCHDYDDPNIYYPKELGDFFRTSPMQRISRILQLGKFIQNDEYVYHTRFEHSLGVYDKKKRIILNLYKDPKFKQYVETHHLKDYLMAELIKSAGHDIGHMPLSHVLELSVIHRKEFHEVMGKRILLENEEIRKVLDKISPTLYQALSTTLSSSILGFNLIDEGNYDIDRFDYITRDLLYRGKTVSLKFEPFTLTKMEDSNHQTKMIPVFDIKSVPAIKNFLNLRQKSYREAYIHPITQIFDASVAITINELIRQNSPYAHDLQVFLSTLMKNIDAKQIDLDEYLSWDDLRLYNELLDVAEFSEDMTLSQLATFILPNLNTLMNILYTMLDLKHTKIEDLNPVDKNLIYRIRDIIHSNQPFARNMKNPAFFNQMVTYTFDQDQVLALKKDASVNQNMFFHSQTLLGYKPSEPIYIRYTDGKIYTIDTLPDRNFAISSKQEEISVAFVLTPFLRLQNKEPDLSLFGKQISPQAYFAHKRKPNMAPLRVGNPISLYFDEK